MSSGHVSAPIGELEGARLAFAGGGAREERGGVGRSAVAMLNGQGGEIWIGLRKEGSRAVAFEPVDEPGREADLLRTYLFDRIDPPPSEAELRVEEVRLQEGALLRVDLAPAPERRPYAWLHPQGGREFLLRVGGGVRILSRDEIVRAFAASGSPGADPESEARQRLLAERDALAERGEGALWIRIEPLRDLGLDLEEPRLEDVLEDPVESGNRRVGFHFAIARHRAIREGDRLRTLSDAQHGLVLRENGGLTFQGSLSLLRERSDRLELNPLALLEYPVSAFRMAREILKTALRDDDRLLADLALLGLRGYHLPTGLPVPRRSRFYKSRTFEAGADLVSARPLNLRSEELLERPDRCAFRLLERVYEAFGYTRESFPLHLQERSGRLVLPE